MRLLFFLPILFVLINCATQPLRVEGTKDRGRWDTRAIVRDFKKQKTNSLSIDFISIWPDRMRADVTGPFGIAVATLAINKDLIQLAIHTQKKFFSGKISDQSLVTLLGFPLDPRVLLYVLFDTPIPGRGWSCRNDKQGIVQDCRNKDTDILVQWTERKDELKRILITREGYEIQILVKDFSTKVQENPDYFKINQPDSYVSHQLD